MWKIHKYDHDAILKVSGPDQHVRFSLILWYAEKSWFVWINPLLKNYLFKVYGMYKKYHPAKNEGPVL